MIRAFSVENEVDLKTFSNSLWQKGIKHRISEESGTQVVWVPDESHADYVRQSFESWPSTATDSAQRNAKDLKAEIELNGNAPGKGFVFYLSLVLWKSVIIYRLAPVSFILIIICSLVALITGFGNEPYRLSFLFFPSVPTHSLVSLLSGLNTPLLLLRSLAPMFLHFGELHIIFNLLWLWYFGQQLETIQKSWQFLLIVVLTSFAANSAQYLSSQAANFGGMSGVVYGLVGYAWILHNFVPGKRMRLNSSIFVVFIIALVLMELVASSWIATAAHVGGLVAGLIAGLFVVVLNRFHRTSAV